MDIPTTTLNEQQSQSFVAFFLSDLHLSPQNVDHIQKLEDFVDEVLLLPRPVKIFFLGDVFDLWVGTASPVKSLVQPILQKLKSLQARGGEVFFFEGNHDLHLDAYFAKRWNFQVVKDSWQGELAGFKVCLEHGDLFDPEDTGYLFLRRFLRKSWVRFLLLNVIPNFVINNVGTYFSKQSSKNTKPKSAAASGPAPDSFPKSTSIPTPTPTPTPTPASASMSTQKPLSFQDREDQTEHKLKTYAASKHTAGIDVFICGHTHKRNFFELSPQKLLINLGTWQGQAPKILGLTSDQKFMFLNITKM